MSAIFDTPWTRIQIVDQSASLPMNKLMEEIPLRIETTYIAGRPPLLTPWRNDVFDQAMAETFFEDILSWSGEVRSDWRSEGF